MYKLYLIAQDKLSLNYQNLCWAINVPVDEKCDGFGKIEFWL